MATRKRRTTSPSPSPSPPRKQQHSQPFSPPTTTTSTTTNKSLAPPTSSPALSNPPLYTQSVDSTLPATPLPADIDMNRCPFTLTPPNHNLLLTLLTQANNTPHPWIKCHKCGKWRKLPPTLSALSPFLPSLPLTLQSLSSLSAPFLPFPFTCAAVHWDLDRRICSAIQDYQDIVHEWHQVPLKLVRANPRFDFYVALAHFLRVKGVTIREYPCIYGKSVDLFALYNIVHWAGGDSEVSRRGWWPAVYERLRLGGKVGQMADVDYLIEIYRSYFFEWQENQLQPPVFEPVAGVGEGKDSTENVSVISGSGSGGGGVSVSGGVGGGKAEVKDDGRDGNERVDEVKVAADSGGEAEDDAAMQETDVKEESSRTIVEEQPHETKASVAAQMDVNVVLQGESENKQASVSEQHSRPDNINQSVDGTEQVAETSIVSI